VCDVWGCASVLTMRGKQESVRERKRKIPLSLSLSLSGRECGGGCDFFSYFSLILKVGHPA
jgi:hypothetical protein